MRDGGGGPQSAFRAYSDLAESGWSEFPTDGATETNLEHALGVGMGAGGWDLWSVFWPLLF